MNQILECVANISEGKRHEIINHLVQIIEMQENVFVLHVDIGEDANRTVITFAGVPEQVITSAYKLIEATAKHINLSIQTGSHPRVGATDVCPLIPIQGITKKEAVKLSWQLAAKVGNNLNIPVYCYEHSAKRSERKELAHIRKGGLETLIKKTRLKQSLPDFGPTNINATIGATIIGVRDFLIAFNVSLATTDVSIAKKIARQIRENDSITSNHRLNGVKAIGWHAPLFNCTQVSTNIKHIEKAGIHQVFEKVEILAKENETNVIGAEIIGLIPLKAMLQSASYYQQKLNILELDEIKKIELVCEQLKLSTHQTFNVNVKILEYNMAEKGLMTLG